MSLFDVDGKFCVVTGGGRGIGEMIATGLVEAGATVLITSRKLENLQETADRLGDACIPVAADLSTQEGIESLAVAVAEHTDRVHVLVNNAGIAWGEPIDEYSRSGFEKVLDINLTAVFHTTQALLPLLRAAATPQDPARVITIGSVDGFTVPLWETYAYSASKAGVHHLSRHMAQRLAPEHITVNVIAPGFFPSDMTAFAIEDPEAGKAFAARIPRGRFGDADDITGAVVFLASRAGAYVTGAILPVDGGVRTTV